MENVCLKDTGAAQETLSACTLEFGYRFEAPGSEQVGLQWSILFLVVALFFVFPLALSLPVPLSLFYVQKTTPYGCDLKIGICRGPPASLCCIPLSRALCYKHLSRASA